MTQITPWTMFTEVTDAINDLAALVAEAHVAMMTALEHNNQAEEEQVAQEQAMILQQALARAAAEHGYDAHPQSRWNV